MFTRHAHAITLTPVPDAGTCAFRVITINRNPARRGEQLGDALLDLLHHAEGDMRAQLFAAASDAYPEGAP